MQSLTPRRWLLLLLFSCLSLYSLVGQAVQLTTADYRLSASTRTLEQIAAFYEARGFPKPAIEVLKQQCYLTVYFHNKSKNIIWVDLGNWRFTTADGPLPRRDRQYWKQQWSKMDLAMRFQSTFRWTLMPERLDFRPDEREGGNLTLPYSKQPIRLNAVLTIINNGEETRKPIQLDGILCRR